MTNLSPHDRTTLNNFNQMTVGQIFKRARQDQNLTIQQIAAHLNIGSIHLEAIEGDDVQALPPKVYAVGFVRAYADLLSLDSEKMAYLFKVQAYGKKQLEEHRAIIQPTFSPITMNGRIGDRVNDLPFIVIKLIGIGIIVVILTFALIWLLSLGQGRDQITVPDVPIEMMENATTPNDDFIQAENVEVPAPVEPMDLIVRPDDGATAYGENPLTSALAFKMKGDNWMELRAVQGGDVMITKTFKAGDVIYVSDNQDILLTTGNAGMIEAYLDNQSLGLLGQDGDIIRLRPFSVKALRLQRGE
jgi:transcriptional regulator with XRE-family HTH domain